MGGKKRGAPRQEKRANAWATELTEANTDAHLSLATVPDSELFVLDTKPDLNVKIYSRKELKLKRLRVLTEETKNNKKRKVILSEKDLRQVKKIIAKNPPQKDITWSEPKKATFMGRNNSTSKSLEVTDLWGDTKEENKKESLRSRNKKHTVAVDVAHSGQSYRPDEEMHQNIIGEALAIELRRNEAEEYDRTPIGCGMSEQTLAVLVDTDNDDDDDEEEDNNNAFFEPKKKKEKLTRAQRNKQRRAKLMKVEHEARKRTKKLLNAVNNIPSLTKEIVREELTKKIKKEELHRLKEEAKAVPLGKNLHEKLLERNPLKVPSLPVALKSELEESGGSLRAVKPKGDLLKERLHSLAVRNLANSKRKTKNIVEGKKRTVRKGMEYKLM